jgi:hypothetical protein
MMNTAITSLELPSTIEGESAMTSPLSTLPNPFRSVIVNDPWQFLETDVKSIHESAFERCREAVAYVRANHRTTALLVFGEAGSGKTHLLARLYAQLALDAEADGPGGLQEAVFVPLRMQASAPILWRFLRREFAKALLRQAEGGLTQLERLLLHRLTEWLHLPEDSRPWLEQQRRTPEGLNALGQQLTDLFDHIDTEGLLNRNLRTVLTRLMLRQQRSDAAAWLRGEGLLQELLERLGVSSEPEEEPEDLAHRLVLGLSSLATAELPIIFSFDQIEALQTHPQDFAGLFAIGQMIRALHDETRHCLVISCVQSVYLDTLRQTVRGADWDGMTEFGWVQLKPLNLNEAQQLAQARLDALPELRELRAKQNQPYWPLEAVELQPLLLTSTGTVVARKLLSHCADLFEARRIGPTPVVAPPVPTPEFLQQTWEQRKEQALAQSKTDETEAILKDGLPRLLHLAQTGLQSLDEQQTRDVDLVVASQGQRVGISICNSPNGTSMAAKLRRVYQQQNRFDKLLILRDQRLPIKDGWHQSKAQRQTLLKGGALWAEPSPECLAALDALRQLLAEAQGGNLENRGENVDAETLRDWLLKHLATELNSILEEILPLSTTTTVSGVAKPVDLVLRERLTEFLQRHHVARLTDAADLLGLENASLSDCALNYPDRFGVLGNPPIVLFELANERANPVPV